MAVYEFLKSTCFLPGMEKMINPHIILVGKNESKGQLRRVIVKSSLKK
jgi:hypothetical protein